MTTQNQQLTSFAQAVGQDYKELKDLLTQLQNTVGQLPQGREVTSQIEQAINTLKGELLDGAEAEYDTLKELADKLKELANSGTVAGAITKKLTELNQKITELETFKTGIDGLDLVETYRQAKNGGGV